MLARRDISISTADGDIMSSDLGLPLVEVADLDLERDWKTVLQHLAVFDSKQILLNNGKEVHHAILCRTTRKKAMELDAEQWNEGPRLSGKGKLFCYKFKV
jgi:hypothetical protein